MITITVCRQQTAMCMSSAISAISYLHYTRGITKQAVDSWHLNRLLTAVIKHQASLHIPSYTTVLPIYSRQGC